MKDKSPSAWTRFLDHQPPDPETAVWEEDPEARRERDDWKAIRSELKTALCPPPLEHGDFINSRVMEAISRDERPRGHSPTGLLRWALGCVAVAVIIALVWVPDVMRPGASSGFGSQIVAVRAVHPEISAAAFNLPGENGVVIWLEGAPYIPEGDQLR